MPPRMTSLIGLFLAVVAILALSGPGRIDIVDGQTRYEVARSLVEHGDPAVRDAEVRFNVFPGRDGQLYAAYRLPQIVLGVAAIHVADATGPVAEPRRQWFFVLTSAAAGAALALFYAVWFGRRGAGRLAACGWAVAGIACTPAWYYATSTFDDILGSTALVGALVASRSNRRDAAATAGVWCGVMIACKPPLGLFVLPVLAGFDRPGELWPRRAGRASVVLVGVAAGMGVEWLYQSWMFPNTDVVAVATAAYGPVWAASLLPGLVCLAISPGCGVLWYAPATIVGVVGTWSGPTGERRFRAALVAAAAGYYCFFAALTFYKGDPAWGPRYLTPVIAATWLFVPDGLARWPRGRILLSAGAVVQLLALAAEPQRLHLERRIPSTHHHLAPWLPMNLAYASLVQRPREILEMCTAAPAEVYSPATMVTKATSSVPQSEAPAAVRRYQVYASWRPWWLGQQYLSLAERPVDLPRTAGLLLALTGLGTGLVFAGTRRRTSA
jgi:hypothetical protein